MSVDKLRAGVTDEPTSDSRRFSPSWETLHEETFAHYDRLLVDVNYGGLIQIIRRQQTEQDRVIDARAEEQASRLRHDYEAAFNRVVPKPFTSPSVFKGLGKSAQRLLSFR